MSGQLSLLDGQQRKERGISRVLDHNSEWAEAAQAVICALAATGQDFTSVEVIERAGEPPHRNAIGGVFNRAAHARIIECVGIRNSVRPSRHAGTVKVWRGR